MKVYIRFNNKEDVTIEEAASTTAKDGVFSVLDDDGDKLLATPEHNVLYVAYSYE